MNIPIYHVDAFTDRPFAGNPAAVCILNEPKSDTWLQSLAAEMNLAETAFLWPRDGGYDLRWLTPTIEVDLCGHATLASAHVLWKTGRLKITERANFYTRSGLLTAARAGAAIELDFPAEREEEIATPDGLDAAIGVRIVYCGRNRMDILVDVADADSLRSIQPDFRRLAELPVRGIIATSLSDRPGCDFLSRFFAPAAGIDEDPVTGSAHSCLGPFWATRLGRSELVGYQASARGGTVGVRMEGDRVMLTGKAVTVLTGSLTNAAS